MRLGDLHDFFIQEGIKADLRPRREVQQQLSAARQAYRKLELRKKKYFDLETCRNPYADSRILYGDPKCEIKRLLVGIDIDVGEILLADELSRSGKQIDLVLSHHPEGLALAGLTEVMSIQISRLQHIGLSPKVAEDLMQKRMEEVARKIHGGNHARAVDAARLLGIPLVSCHTIADNHVNGFLQKTMDARKPGTLQEVVDILLKEPEYQEAVRFKAGPKILVGKPTDKAGRIFVDMTGGTEGSPDIFARLSQCGIGTILGMHLSETHFSKIKTEYINVIIAGHMASDSLGMNLVLDKLQRQEHLDIMSCSGFRRFQRSWGKYPRT